MGGYGLYVWLSYGVTAVLLIVEVVALNSRRRAADQAADDDVASRGPER